MQLLTDICNETGLSIDDARLILIDVRPDWESTDSVTNSEAELIRQSAHAALSENDGEIAPVTGMDLEQQQRLVNNASQVLAFPLALSISQELRMTETLALAKNQAILNILDQAQSELDQEIHRRTQSQQQAFIAAIQEIAESLEKPTEVAQMMETDIKATNSYIEALMQSIKSKVGKAA